MSIQPRSIVKKFLINFKMRIVYQKSAVNPKIYIPIYHLNDDVGEHIVIARNPERAISIQSILRDDGGVDHPLLEANVYQDLQSMMPLVATPVVEDNHHLLQAIVTPPRVQRALRDGQLPGARPHPVTECWKTTFSLTVLALLKVFHRSIGTALGQLEFEPVGMSFPDLLENILNSNHANAYEFLDSMKERTFENCVILQLQVLLFLCGLNIGPGRESIVSSEYPSILTSSPVTGEVKRIFLHPQSTIFQLEMELFSSADMYEDWEKLLVLAADINDGPYFDMEFSSFPENEKRLYHVACSYMCSMRRCVRLMVEDHDIIPFNVGFATEIWLRVIHNIKARRVHTLGLNGDVLKLVKSIFAFYDQGEDPHSHSKCASIMYTSKGARLAWLVHPVEESYSLV